MRLIIAAVGRMKSGAEQELVSRYLDRIAKSGKAIGITMVDVVELPEGRASSPNDRKEQEATALLDRLPPNCAIVAFDERGKSPSSKMFAANLQSHLDEGTTCLAMLIGGPDGLALSLRKKTTNTVSFGALTLPHQIVRILVAEQVYRAVTILTGHPYHRD